MIYVPCLDEAGALYLFYLFLVINYDDQTTV